MTSTREQIMDSHSGQLEPHRETDHREPLGPTTPVHTYRPPIQQESRRDTSDQFRPQPGDYAGFDAVPRQSSPAPVSPPPTPVMFPGQTMMVLFLLMVAAAFWGSVLFYLVLKFLHLIY